MISLAYRLSVYPKSFVAIKKTCMKVQEISLGIKNLSKLPPLTAEVYFLLSWDDLFDFKKSLTKILGIYVPINFIYFPQNPKEVDTYVRWEFPFPRDAPVTDKTPVIKNTNNPAYESKESKPGLSTDLRREARSVRTPFKRYKAV